MADLADVENALVAALVVALYPGGTGQPSVAGVDCRVYRGWPVSKALDLDLAAGKVNVTVFSRPGMTQRRTRYFRRWLPAAAAVAPTLTAIVSGQTVTFGGTPTAGENVAVVIEAADFTYAVPAGATLASVAAAIAALIAAQQTATSSGAVLTVPDAVNLTARVGGAQPMIQEVRRQNQGFQVVIWAPDPATRDTVAAAADLALATTNFLALADGSGGRLLYHGTAVNDVPQKEHEWRRDLIVTVEYATTTTLTAPQAIVLRGLTQGAAMPLSDFTPGVTPPPMQTEG